MTETLRQACETTPGSAPNGVVIGVGRAADAAAAYATASGRPVRVVASLANPDLLTQDAASAFLVLLEPELDYAAAAKITAASVELDLPVGVLPLTNRELQTTELMFLLAEKAAPAVAGRSALYCDFVPYFHGAHDTAFGRDRSEEFLALARTGLDAAVVHGHGNGADFRLGSDVLCLRIGGAAPAALGEGFLPCQAGGPVGRTTMPPSEPSVGRPRYLSGCWCSLRAGVAAAVAGGMLDEPAARVLLAEAKATFYPDRSWPAKFAAGLGRGVPGAQIEALREFVRQAKPNAKRADALALLRRSARLGTARAAGHAGIRIGSHELLGEAVPQRPQRAAGRRPCPAGPGWVVRLSARPRGATDRPASRRPAVPAGTRSNRTATGRPGVPLPQRVRRLRRSTSGRTPSSTD